MALSQTSHQQRRQEHKNQQKVSFRCTLGSLKALPKSQNRLARQTRQAFFNRINVGHNT